MLAPKKVKFRKNFRGHLTGTACRKIVLAFGDYGLKAMENSWVSARQIEAARRTITGFLKRGGKIWIRVFPDKPYTLKGGEIRMGGGKGGVDHYVAAIKKGTIMFEIDGVEEKIAREACKLAGYKLPVLTKFITKQ